MSLYDSLINKFKKIKSNTPFKTNTSSANSTLNTSMPINPASIQSYGLGTIIQITAWGENAEIALDEAVEKIGEIDDEMSFYKKESDISRINENAGLDFQIVNKDTYYVIETAVKFSKLSEGAINLTVRPLVSLWGVGSGKVSMPSKEAIQDNLKLVNYNDIEFNEKDRSIKLKQKGQSIDVNCIAKGYAADEVKRVLEKHNIKNAIINLGGNVYVMGSKIDNSPWKIGIQHPMNKRGNYVGFLDIINSSIVTSGDYEKFFMYNGNKYHHIIDPNTGYPVKNKIVSTTIISEYSIDGDALTTCLYVMGIQKGLHFIENFKGIDAIIITEDKKIYGTKNIMDKFIISDKDFEMI